MATQGRLRLAREGATLTIQAEGRATADEGFALRRLAEQAAAEGATALHVDLRQCGYMDSTFLGTLLHLGRGPLTFAVVSPSPACLEQLRGMGLQALIPTLTADALPETAWQELPGERHAASALWGTVVTAHEALAEVPGATGQRFRGVADCLRREARQAE